MIDLDIKNFEFILQNMEANGCYSKYFKVAHKVLNDRGYWKNKSRSPKTIIDTGKTFNGTKIYSSPDVTPDILYSMTVDFVQKKPRRSGTLEEIDKNGY